VNARRKFKTKNQELELADLREHHANDQRTITLLNGRLQELQLEIEAKNAELRRLVQACAAHEELQRERWLETMERLAGL
jgi:uncharacterized coiled-coil protein SlyX